MSGRHDGSQFIWEQVACVYLKHEGHRRALLGGCWKEKLFEALCYKNPEVWIHVWIHHRAHNEILLSLKVLSWIPATNLQDLERTQDSLHQWSSSLGVNNWAGWKAPFQSPLEALSSRLMETYLCRWGSSQKKSVLIHGPFLKMLMCITAAFCCEPLCPVPELQVPPWRRVNEPSQNNQYIQKRHMKVFLSLGKKKTKLSQKWRQIVLDFLFSFNVNFPINNSNEIVNNSFVTSTVVYCSRIKSGLFNNVNKPLPTQHFELQAIALTLSWLPDSRDLGKTGVVVMTALPVCSCVAAWHSGVHPDVGINHHFWTEEGTSGMSPFVYRHRERVDAYRTVFSLFVNERSW